MPQQPMMPPQGMGMPPQQGMPMQADPSMQGGGGISALLDALLGSGQPLPPELMAMLGIDPMSMMGGPGMPQGMPQGMPGMPMVDDELQEAFARMMQQRQMQQPPQGMPQQGMPMQGGM